MRHNLSSKSRNQRNAGRQASIFVCIEALEPTEIQLGLEELSEFHMPITDKLGNELRSSETTGFGNFYELK